MLTGLCPDWESWDPRKPVDNAREAMQQADDWLGVPQVRVHPCLSHEAVFPYVLWMPLGLAGSLTSSVVSFQGALTVASHIFPTLLIGSHYLGACRSPKNFHCHV